MKQRWKSISLFVGAAAAGHFIAYKITHIPRQLEAALLFAAAILYPVLRNPLLGAYLFFSVSPFITYLRRLYYLVYDRPEVDPLLMTGEFIILFILGGLFFTFRERPIREPGVAFYARMVIIYLAFLALRVFAFQMLPLVQAVAAFKFYGPSVLLFFVGMHYADRFRHLKALWIMTIIIGAAAALYGLKQLYLGYSQAEQIWFNAIDFSTLAIKGVVRPFSFFQAPVVFADYLQLAIIGVMLLRMWEKRLPFFAVAPLVALYVYAILMTSVRSSWVGMISTPLFHYFFVGIRGWGKRAAVFAVMIAAFIAYESLRERIRLGGVRQAFAAIQAAPSQSHRYVDLLINERATALTNPFEEHSFRSRMNTWSALLLYTMDPEMALVGRGLGSLRADSLYFTYLAEFGYPGMIFIIFILIVFIRKGLAIIDQGGDPRVIALAKAITVMNLVMALMSITGTHIHTFPGDAYFWFFNGVLVNIGALQRALASPGAPSFSPGPAQ